MFVGSGFVGPAGAAPRWSLTHGQIPGRFHGSAGVRGVRSVSCRVRLSLVGWGGAGVRRDAAYADGHGCPVAYAAWSSVEDAAYPDGHGRPSGYATSPDGLVSRPLTPAGAQQRASCARGRFPGIASARSAHDPVRLRGQRRFRGIASAVSLPRHRFGLFDVPVSRPTHARRCGAEARDARPSHGPTAVARLPNPQQVRQPSLPARHVSRSPSRPRTPTRVGAGPGSAPVQGPRRTRAPPDQGPAVPLPLSEAGA